MENLRQSDIKDTLLQVDGQLSSESIRSESIRMETPLGAIEVDESPIIDVLIIVLMFSAFCIYIYAKYFKKNHE